MVRSIERRVLKITSRNPAHSSFINFCGAVKGQQFTRPKIAKWFNRLVKKEDYDKKDRRKLIVHCFNLSNDIVEINKVREPKAKHSQNRVEN